MSSLHEKAEMCPDCLGKRIKALPMTELFAIERIERERNQKLKKEMKYLEMKGLLKK